ncbi:MAG: hypothetical protein K0Q49_30 [Haloplasmataceae bacterium]|jgi:hypothetical protein|nr:hypothetical protein [Haloplasmataceae bacterium]
MGFEDVVDYLLRFFLEYTDEPFIEERFNDRDNVKFINSIKELGLEELIAKLQPNKAA